ncbi:NnrU family protein [Pseudooceanicola sp.]|uniref:NnrU family protein n=1 Tax=Pseudooceanicola sp. TaxID=1914328 RepID=UPI0026218F7B|nr:NnrU family protein [Pseudooceanicola sp.]MDF1856905.1 NnrU family protein [Pseudooceanicola sp.]
MLLIALGLILWTWPHLMKSVTPSLQARLGDRVARPLAALFALAAIVLMVIGYRSAAGAQLYTPPVWGVHANSLLNLIAVALMGAGSSKSHLRNLTRHPMNLGLLIWCLAHLLVRGSEEAVLLWGGLAVWSLLAIALTDRAARAKPAFAGASLAGDLRLTLIALALYGVIVWLHILLGLQPFGG